MQRFRMSAWCTAVVVLVSATAPCWAQEADPILAKVPREAVAVLVIKDALGAEARIAALLKQLLPETGPVPVITGLLGEILDDPTAIKGGSPLIMVVACPDDFDRPPLTCALLDVTNREAFLAGAKPDEDGILAVPQCEQGFCAPYNGLLMMGKRKAVAAMKGSPAGVNLSAEQTQMWDGSDAFAMANLAALVTAATPKYQEARAETAGALEQLGPDAAVDPQQIADAKAKLALMDSLWGYARQMDWAAAGASVGPAGVDFQMAMGVQPGSKLAGYLTGHPALGAKLTPGLPKVASTWAAFWYAMDSTKVGEAVADLFSVAKGVMGMVPAEGGPAMMPMPGANPKQMADMFAKMEIVFKRKMDLLSNQGAGLAMLVPDGGVANSLMATKVGDRQAYLKKTDQMVQVEKELAEASLDLMAGAAGKPKVETTFERNAQTLGDLAIDRMAFKMTFPAPGPDAPAAPHGGPAPDMGSMLKRLWGGDTVTTWMTHKNEYLLMQIGPKPDRLAELAQAVSESGHLADTPEIAAMRKGSLPDANMVGFVSLATYMNIAMSSMVQAMGGAMPQMPPPAAAARSTFSVAAGKNRLAVRMVVPVGEMQQMMMNFMMVQMMFMQQMPLPPGPPPGAADEPLM